MKHSIHVCGYAIEDEQNRMISKRKIYNDIIVVPARLTACKNREECSCGCGTGCIDTLVYASCDQSENKTKRISWQWQ